MTVLFLSLVLCPDNAFILPMFSISAGLARLATELAPAIPMMSLIAELV